MIEAQDLCHVSSVTQAMPYRFNGIYVRYGNGSSSLGG